MKKLLIISALCCLTACSSSSSKVEDDPEDQPKNVYYNPVINYSLPDPSVIRGEDDYFYLYATENIRNLPIHRSKNLVDWEYVGTAFTNDTRPDFEPKGGLWAPDINKIGDKYVLYYSMSVWGGEWTCGIGCATADKPEGPFKDHGKMFRSNEINVQNSIDPFYIEEGGRKYLFWGSFRGIYAIEHFCRSSQYGFCDLQHSAAGRRSSYHASVQRNVQKSKSGCCEKQFHARTGYPDV